MTHYDNNVYYSPEASGLKVIDVYENDEPWQFAMFVLWEDEDGKLLWGTDSGCSCPCPFENTTKESLTYGTFEQAKEELLRSSSWWSRSKVDIMEYAARMRQHFADRNLLT